MVKRALHSIDTTQSLFRSLGPDAGRGSQRSSIILGVLLASRCLLLRLLFFLAAAMAISLAGSSSR